MNVIGSTFMDLNIENKKRQIHFHGVIVDENGEDDNEDIAYINVQIVWFYVINYFVLFLFAMLAIFFAETEYDPQTNFLLNATYRVLHETIGYCIELKPPTPYINWLSILRMVDTYVISNIMFRLACGLSLCYRIFMPWALWAKLVFYCPRSLSFKIGAAVMLILQKLEVCCLMIFSINMLKFDYKYVYYTCFVTWLIANPCIMFLSSWLQCYDPFEQGIDRLSIITKIGSTIIFIFYAPQFYFTHNNFIWAPKCHPYVRASEALVEYFVFMAYFVFNLCLLPDIRDIRGLIYPRSISGECEKIIPCNYRKGARYERGH
ncbi:unnamed protein product [Bursaphelenchus okinawaensis]|uniref:Uncharacterized protein n=1 Tax=Bursaphelenchus okinawaensis TaxID=465554 RepID=A0A811L4E6_9BILA|nr:unnamed protein product [Bursaphelenchus okinawaensis]CAG9119422.1 unnamed protein product [Bursaphelenchus okinawaensis]